MNVKVANRVRTAVTIVATLIMVYALFVSRDHITHVALLIGLGGYQASTLFVLIDLPALVGKAMQLKYFAASTRRTGKRLMWMSGSLSFACNVVSGWFGGGYGPAGYGAFVVIMFLVMENAVTKIKPAAAVTRAKNVDNAETPARPTAKATARKATPRARKATGSVAALEQAYALPSAPVSGA
jgi:hypothetical protein